MIRGRLAPIAGWIAAHPVISIVAVFAVLPFLVPYTSLATQILVYGLFALGFATRRGTRAGAYAGIVASLLFVSWATATGPLQMNWGFNFRMNSLLIGVISHFVLFGVGYAASVTLGGHRPELAGLTVWDPPPASEAPGTFHAK